MAGPKSRKLFARARKVIPGGVNSPVRAFRAVGGTPPFLASGKGARVTDVDGRSYVDYVGSWGSLIVGHAHPAVLRAVRRAAARGTSFGAPTEGEVVLAERVCEALPSVQKVRFVSSGTEATMSALRLARAATGRKLILKFDGCYHGHADTLLVGAGSGVATLGIPGSPGVPEEFARLTIQAPYNDVDAVESAFRRHRGQIACVIVEPVAGNMGCVPPEPGFLQAIVELCRKHGAASVFDEVMTGCRVARGGAQERYELEPDLTCLGKVVGGGLPLAAYGGRGDIMRRVAPLGPVYQAGTLSGNPLAVSAGLATLEHLTPPVYDLLEALGARLEAGLDRALLETETVGTVQRVGSMLTLFFRPGRVRSYADAGESNRERFAAFHAGLLSRGVYWPPSQFEAAFVSAAHTEADIDATIAAAKLALAG